MPFLNQDTPFLPGPERIARKTNYPVFYFDVDRVKRGYYEITASLLHESPSETADTAITQSYANKLESIIQQKPANWLWSHRRWKKKKIINEVKN